MERTKKFSDEKIRWKKIGGGSLRLNGRIIKPGEVFTAHPSQIPKAFKDVIVPLEKEKEIESPPIHISSPEYKIQVRGKGKTWFDVIGPNGKALNEKALTKEVAQKLVEDLSR